MKKLKQINLVLLVAGHLLLFVYPMTSKTFHVHQEPTKEHCCSCETSGPAIDQPTPDCPICDYVLVSFISESTFSPSVYRFAYPVEIAPLPETVHTEAIRHFSLRGPPIA